MPEALARIADAMGPEAVVLAVQEGWRRGLFRRRPVLYVTAGSDSRALRPDRSREAVKPVRPRRQFCEKTMEDRVTEFLASRGVPADTARSWATEAVALADGAHGMDEIARALQEIISGALRAPSRAGPACPSVSVLVGPCGVGKTTSTTKLASREFRRGRRASVVSLDEGHPSAAILASYAERAGIPCLRTRSLDAVRALARRTAGTGTVFVDTEGKAPGQIAKIHELAGRLHGMADVGLQLVLPATMSVADMRRSAKQFAPFGYSNLLVTHVDEAVSAGAAVSLADKLSVPISYLGTGPDFASDLVEADPIALASMVVVG